MRLPFIWIFAIVSLAAVYFLIVRPWLVRQPALSSVYQMLDTHEAGLFAKLRVSFSGLKRLLTARLVWVVGFLVTVHEFLAANQTIFSPLIPPEYQIYILPAMTATGFLFEQLSKISPTPVGQVNPAVIASTTEVSIDTVARVTAPDPVVAAPTVEQMVAADPRPAGAA